MTTWKRQSRGRTVKVDPASYSGTHEIDPATARRAEEFMEKRLGWKRPTRPNSKPEHRSCVGKSDRSPSSADPSDPTSSDTSIRSTEERPDQPSDETD